LNLERRALLKFQKAIVLENEREGQREKEKGRSGVSLGKL
jgi:hypothetical protein